MGRQRCSTGIVKDGEMTVARCCHGSDWWGWRVRGGGGVDEPAVVFERHGGTWDMEGEGCR